jgi:hypothetical protein
VAGRLLIGRCGAYVSARRLYVKKIERLRLALAPLCPASCSISAELEEAGLFGMQVRTDATDSSHTWRLVSSLNSSRTYIGSLRRRGFLGGLRHQACCLARTGNSVAGATFVSETCDCLRLCAAALRAGSSSATRV